MAILTSFLTAHQKFMLSKLPYAYHTLMHHFVDGVPIGDMTAKSDTHCHIKSIRNLANYILEGEEARLVRVKVVNVTNYDQRVLNAFRNGDQEFLKSHREMLHAFS